MNMLRYLVVCAVFGAGTLVAADPVSLMPGVSEVKWGDALSAQGPAVIVLAEQAGPVERSAARLLAQYAERRLGQSWSVQTSREAARQARLRVYLGLPAGFPELDALCKAQRLSVPDRPDGYALKVWKDGDAVIAVVAGANTRGVIYGQDTLSQLLSRQGSGVAVQQATIRDWPTIPLRGRPHPHFEYFLDRENFDCMAMSRINFIDLRDGIYAFEPGAKLKRDDLSAIIRDARDHGLRVYAAVNCGVPAAEQDAVISLFKEFLDLGADALWASFDDRGAGEKPLEMVAKVLALGREHGISGDAIAVTPPKGDYQTIDTPFNRSVVGVPGMEQAVWYWTCVPGPEESASGESIGLRVPPSWWHNWPRFHLPSLHLGAGAYVPVVSLAKGWNRPNERELNRMGPHVHAVMPWDGWRAQQHYLVPTIGWFSWRPEQYDFQQARRRIYDVVFGPEQVAAMTSLDDDLERIKSRFQFWSTHTDYAPQCPPRLKRLEDRETTRRELEALQTVLLALQSDAPSVSLVSRDLLQKEYLEPLAREMRTGLAAIAAPYPEYWWPSHQDEVLRALYAGDTSRAESLIAAVRGRVLEEVNQVERLMEGHGAIGPYAQWWRKRAKAGADEWQKLIAQRRSDLATRIAEYSRTVAPTGQMLAGLDDPPIQVGTGAWERHNTVLATVVPQPHETFWGDWIGGTHTHQHHNVAVFALDKHLRVNSNTFSELPVSIPVSGRRDRLALLIYLSDINKESFGLGRAKWRWSGYRSIRLLWEDQELWKADLGIPRLLGEWFVVPLPELPADLETLALRLRVEDYRPAKNNLQIVYVGPIRLLEIDGD